MKAGLTLLLLFIFVITFYAQKGTVHGRVTDTNGNPLIGVNIIVEGTLLGTATDYNGKYKLQGMKNGTYKISFSMIGYKKFISKPLNLNNNSIELNVELESLTYRYDELVITANKHSQKLNEVAASTYIIDANNLSQKNFQKIDDALRYAPGVTLTLDQISIRGSSGYSRGAGTRVLITFDGIPIYTPDTGEIVWELVPVTEIGRVEILKGAASSLYGSSALGGIINITPKELTSNPVTFVKLNAGTYSKPVYKEWQWTNKLRYFNTQTVSHSRSMGKLSISVSLSRFEDFNYKQNHNQLRFSGYLKSKYKFSETTSLSFIGTGFTRKRNTFIFWRDLQHALSPPDKDLGQSIKSDRTILGINFNHIFNKNFSLTVIPSLYLSYWKDESESNNKSNGKLFRTEARINYEINKKLNIVSGSEFQFNNVTSSIFGNRTSFGIGFFSQADYKFLMPFNLSFGLRFDLNKLSNLQNEYSFSPKLGLTYKINNNTFVRTSLSKGFRAPTLAEAFTSTTTSGITVKPNPNLKAENSFSFEAGIRHFFSNKFSLDFSIFNNEYFDFIEPGIDPKDGKVIFNNVTRARVQGAELNVATSLLSKKLTAKFGYTFLHSKDLELNEPLKYRPEHSLVASMEFKKDFYQAGVDLRYSSKVERIDIELVKLGLVPDGDKLVSVFVLDARAGVNLFPYKIPLRIFLNANNMLNYNYVEMIGNIAPPRNFSLSLEAVF